MKDLAIFKENIRFKNWCEVYVGFNNSWITGKDILHFIEKGFIRSSTPDDFPDFFLALENSLNNFCQLICEKINIEHRIEMTADSDRPEDNLKIMKSAFGDGYFDFYDVWQFEFLSRIRISERTLSEKIYDIYLVWTDFKYFKVDWSGFLWISNLNSGPGSEETLYDNFIFYLDSLKEKLRS